MPIDNRDVGLEQIRTRLREAPLGAIRQMMPDSDILDACREHGYEWRERVYGPVATVFHFLTQAIQREESFAATWQELWTPLAAEFPGVAEKGTAHSALTHARARFPKEVMATLARRACRDTPDGGARWKGLRLRAIDGTTESMPREDVLFEHFGRHNTKHGPTRFPLARFVSLLDVETCTIMGYRFGPHAISEVEMAMDLIELLGSGDLALLDRGFTGSPSMARIRARGAEFLGRKNARLDPYKAKVIEHLGHDDFIAELPMSKSARGKDPSLPDTVTVRLFKATWQSPTGERVTEWFVTSLMDSKRFTKRKLAMLYHERWRIETSYAEFKQTFHTNMLRSKTKDNIYKELAAHVLAYQLVRRLIATAAAKHGKRPVALSFLGAARWTASFSRVMSSARPQDLPLLYERLLNAIAANDVDVRPGRIEPRAIARERKHYPSLRQPRATWREARLRKAG
jgi:hypothetical protein